MRSVKAMFSALFNVICQTYITSFSAGTIVNTVGTNNVVEPF